MKTFVKLLCQTYPKRQAMTNVHIQQTFPLEKGLHPKSNRFEQNIEELWNQNGKVKKVEQQLYFMIFAVKNGAIHQVSTTSSITSSVTSSVTPIQQNLPSTSTPTQPSSSESSNKTSRGQTYREKMKEMLENR